MRTHARFGLATLYARWMGIIIFLALFTVLALRVYAAPIMVIEEPLASGGAIASTCLSHDGRYIVTGMGNGANLWDAETGELLHEFPEIIHAFSCAFSFDNRMVAFGHETYTATIYDIETGKRQRSFRTPTPPTRPWWTGHVSEVAFSSDGKYLITRDVFYECQIWDIATGEMYMNLHSKFDGDLGINAWQFVPIPNSNIIFMTESERVVEFDITRGEIGRVVLFGCCPKLSINARYLIMYELLDIELGRDEGVRILNLDSNETISSLRMQPGTSNTQIMDISPNGEYFIIGGESRSPDLEFGRRVYRNGELIHSFELDTKDNNSPYSADRYVRFFPDGKRFLTLNGNRVHVWDIDKLVTDVPDSALHDD